MVLCPLYGHLFPLWSHVPSKTLCPLYGPLSPLQPSVPLWPSVPSAILYSLCGPVKNIKTSEMTPLASQMFSKMHFVKTPRVIAIYFV
jgi:hypothetical protein